MQFFKITCLCMIALYLPACSTVYHLPKPPHIYNSTNPYPPTPISTERQSTTNQIIYVTDRQAELSKDGSSEFGADRSRRVRFGVADVTIGDNNTWSDLVEAANSDIPRVKFEANMSNLNPVGEFPETPMKFTVGDDGDIIIDPDIAAALSEARNELSGLIRKQMKTSQNQEVIVFIHGYKTPFEDAIFTVNDIHHYSGRHGVPIAYSWPSNDGNLLFGYFRDRSSAEFTVYHLKEFFRTLMDVPDVSKIHIVAHSLGTDVTTTALRELIIETRGANINPREKFKIENLILAAPDLDYGIVTQRLIAEQIGPAFGRVTVYTNAKDRALSLSNMINSGIRFGKLLPGQEKAREIEIFDYVKNVNFIKVEGGSDGFFNHGYFNKDPATLSDIITLITNPVDPGTTVRPLKKLDGNFWGMDANYLKPSEDSPKAAAN